LTLDRKGDSLSGGELQRVRLATSVGTGLIGVCYVLDEPSIGLHPRDTQRLIEILRSLQKRGNTIVVVEHDEAIMKAADLLVDIGPGAGVHGGEIIACGTPKKISRVAESITGQYLLGTQKTHAARERPVEDDTPKLKLSGVTKNNLRNVSVEFPLGRLVGITGVSGSGKSTLIHDSLVAAIQSSLSGTTLATTHWKRFTGADQIDRLVEIDQSPIGRSPRSVPATYCGLWDDIRKIYASTRDAKQRGFNAVRFSFNAGNGRCDACAGQGRQKLEMSFLEDVDIPCPECVGKRFNRQTLAVHFKGKSIADVLEMTVDEAVEFFENMDSLKRSLQRLQDVGLGYITLGQRSTTLSGGEAQRLKLANELTRTATGKTLYVLDEPTTGLHLSDVAQLIQVLQGLVDRGNSVLVIEHHMDLIQSCDWVIDLGPEGGNQGGKILAVGTPAMLAKLDTPTGIALREVMA
jgi:excinuclease ABC subunit A